MVVNGQDWGVNTLDSSKSSDTGRHSCPARCVVNGIGIGTVRGDASHTANYLRPPWATIGTVVSDSVKKQRVWLELASPAPL